MDNNRLDGRSMSVQKAPRKKLEEKEEELASMPGLLLTPKKKMEGDDSVANFTGKRTNETNKG